MISTWITDENLARARELWLAGLSAQEIAKAIGSGATKSAIVGKAHRENWPPRPSPIRWGGVPAVAVPRIPDQPHRKGAKPRTYAERKRRTVAKPPPVPSPSPAVVVAPLSVPTAGPRYRECQWLEGTDRRSWRPCGEPVMKGAWCACHYRIAYARSARQEAA